MKDSIFKSATLEKIKNMRTLFLWVAIWALIGILAFGAILILTRSWDILSGKILTTAFYVTLFLFVGVNNFARMENSDKRVQVFALIGFVGNLLWLPLAILLLWEVVPYLNLDDFYGYNGLTIFGKLTSIAIISSLMSFWISNVIAIKNTTDAIKPLKGAAVICAIYYWVYSTITIVVELAFTGPFSDLLFLVIPALILTTLAAFIISKANEKRQLEKINNANSEEMTATIQEIVEKEVKERLAAERKKAEQAERPPLQSDDMSPSVTRDHAVEIGKPTTAENTYQK